MEIDQKIRIGMLTPSSNSVVEPWCYKIIGSIENVSVHFGRVEVLWIDDKEASLSQFYDENMIKGFDLLSHVKPMVIGWNGTSASWLGLERDRILIDVIKKRTGCRVVSSTLSIINFRRDSDFSSSSATLGHLSMSSCIHFTSSK